MTLLPRRDVTMDDLEENGLRKVDILGGGRRMDNGDKASEEVFPPRAILHSVLATLCTIPVVPADLGPV